MPGTSVGVKVQGWKKQAERLFRNGFRVSLLAGGILAMSCGTLCLVTERIVVVPNRQAVSLLPGNRTLASGFGSRGWWNPAQGPRELALPPWQAAMLLSLGTITACAGWVCRKG